MLTRRLQRALLDTRWQPPTFLLPWAVSMSTASASTESGNVPSPLINAGLHSSPDKTTKVAPTPDAAASAPKDAPKLPASTATSSPMELSQTVRDLLPSLRAQKPHYMTAHIYDKPYLITQGDTVRLPFLMHGVEPGDILRLNRAVNFGSRDLTIKPATPSPKLRSPTTITANVLDPTTGQAASESRVMPSPGHVLDGGRTVVAPHYIPHIAKGKHAYLDDRLFVCRAVVMGVESEPLRIKEKTKRRQRRVKHVKSKHRFTIVKISELRLRSQEEIDSGIQD
ncbi:hypothetical protein K431DRAFT_281437 [Polychaeton citri CBS 116435]|uniref:Ribosomal protein L21 n=1 Tax=Polychaeton citri CBS 116435 TaxID=1314669 RepID=A0A9P4USF5_9PEZI|nr:hypothetical protein K431DRAFT_281437 [Polychaeton citri CBS 116435]